MVATVQPFGVVVAELFEVSHNEQLLWTNSQLTPQRGYIS